jgi:hypothetical protein
MLNMFHNMFSLIQPQELVVSKPIHLFQFFQSDKRCVNVGALLCADTMNYCSLLHIYA